MLLYFILVVTVDVLCLFLAVALHSRIAGTIREWNQASGVRKAHYA